MLRVPVTANQFFVVRLSLALVLLVLASDLLALDRNSPLKEFGRQRWLSENGLPQSTVHAIVQSSDGYIWIATEQGLARFDGINFAVFDKHNTPQLKSNNIWSLAEDREHALWIGTRGGLVRFFAGEFRSFSRADGLPSDVIESVYADSHNSVWIATAGGLARFNNGAFTSRQGIPGNTVQALFEDRDGTLWIGTPSGISQFKDEKFIGNALSEINGSILAISQDQNGQMWFGTSDGLIELDAQGPHRFTVADGLPFNRISCILSDREGSLWIGTPRGLSRRVGTRFESPQAEESLARDAILSLLEDQEGSVWVGAESRGLTLIRNKKFVTYTARDGLGADLVKAIYQDSSGAIWFGTDDGGLSVLRKGSIRNYTNRDGLSSNTVLALAGDEEGTIWIGTPKGLNRFKNGKFTIYTSTQGLPNDYVRSISPGSNRSVWIGTRGGLSRLENDKFTNYTSADGLADNFVEAVYEDAQHSVWIGTIGGLSRMLDGKFITYTTRDGLPSDAVTCLAQDAGGVLWIGSNDGGLARFADGKFTRFTSQDGLPDDTVYGILSDNQGNLWLSTRKGIMFLKQAALAEFQSGQARSLNPTLYGISDGLLTDECSSGGDHVSFKTRDGKLWFATIKGVATVDPARLTVNSQPPNVVLERVSIDDQQVSTRQAIRLGPGKTRFDFYYTALSFVAPEKVRFKYKLEGFDKDWIDGGARRVAYYTNLPPGQYRFRVIAANNDGVWNETGAAFEFYLEPHFYRTYWFYSLCALGLLLLGWLIYRLRLSRMRTQFAAVLAERNRIAREIHDNLAQEMLGISVQLELVARTMPPGASAAKSSLDRARVLVRHGIAEARRYVWDLRSPALDQNDLPAALRDTARRLTAGTQIQAQIEVSGAFRPLGDRIENNLLRISQEAINNAVRHADAQHILISLRFDPGRLRLSIRDDGRGLGVDAPEVEGHFGLLGMRERAAEIGGTWTIHGANGSGTEVVVELPVGADQKNL